MQTIRFIGVICDMLMGFRVENLKSTKIAIFIFCFQQNLKNSIFGFDNEFC